MLKKLLEHYFIAKKQANFLQQNLKMEVVDYFENYSSLVQDEFISLEKCSSDVLFAIF